MNPINCETCVNNVYDDDAGAYFCEADFDMDDMERFLTQPRRSCPYYQSNDEYEIVRKQN